jgi:hypothetical protein
MQRVDALQFVATVTRNNVISELSFHRYITFRRSCKNFKNHLFAPSCLLALLFFRMKQLGSLWMGFGESLYVGVLVKSVDIIKFW